MFKKTKQTVADNYDTNNNYQIEQAPMPLNLDGIAAVDINHVSEYLHLCKELGVSYTGFIQSTIPSLFKYNEIVIYKYEKVYKFLEKITPTGQVFVWTPAGKKISEKFCTTLNKQYQHSSRILIPILLSDMKMGFSWRGAQHNGFIIPDTYYTKPIPISAMHKMQQINNLFKEYGLPIEPLFCISDYQSPKADPFLLMCIPYICCAVVYHWDEPNWRI